MKLINFPYRIIWGPTGKIMHDREAGNRNVVFLSGTSLKFESALKAFNYIDRSRRFEKGERDLCIVMKIIDREDAGADSVDENNIEA